MTYDLKKLRPAKAMDTVMTTVIQQLKHQALNRFDERGRRTFDGSPSTIRPVVFGEYPACALFGVQHSKLCVLYDQGGQPVQVPWTWKETHWAGKELQDEIAAGTSGVPDGLTLHDCYIVRDIWVYVFSGKMTAEALAKSQQLTTAQIVRDDERLLYSTNFARVAAKGWVTVDRADDLTPEQLKAANERAKLLAQRMSFKVGRVRPVKAKATAA